MKQKRIFSILSCAIFFLVGFLGYKAYHAIEVKRQNAEKVHALPSLPFTFIGNKPETSGKPVIIEYFSPDCEHCQNMAKEIIKYKSRFSNSVFIMVSPAKSSEIEKFGKDYGLNTLKFISLASYPTSDFYKMFGEADVPSFFLYNSRHIVTKSFRGETKFETLLSIVN